jgi:phosphoribosylformylglycinamidine cyclo-ligase
MGIGMILAINEKDVTKAQEILAKANRKTYVIGKVTDKPGVEIELLK